MVESIHEGDFEHYERCFLCLAVVAINKNTEYTFHAHTRSVSIDDYITGVVWIYAHNYDGTPNRCNCIVMFGM